MTESRPRLSDTWQLALSPAGAWQTPSDAEGGSWLPARVPGTVAASLERAGVWDRREPTPLHDQDVWYHTTIEGQGVTTLVFEGLATIADVWLDDTMVARSDSMFAPLEVAVALSGIHQVAIAFRSLAADLATRSGPRARWRTRMVDDPRLRFVRTTLLGHAPGWCPPIHAVGPWRPVRVRDDARPRLLSLRTEVAGSAGLVTVAFEMPALAPEDMPRIAIIETEVPLVRGADRVWRATLRLENVVLWWPCTHGKPHLYDIELRTTGGPPQTLARTGFRTLAVDRGADGGGFDLMVNGVRIFCRGLCWTPDPVTLDGTKTAIEPLLRALAEANVNMLRVGGTMVYESADFHALCDELGMLVWQDCMLANFDYPRDEAFTAKVQGEVEALFRRTAGSPSLVVLCGGSEILQQAAMMGLPPYAAAHPLFEAILPALVATERPDIVYVPGSPSGGALPFVVDAGPSHYYGVGAYTRPLEDARRAAVRFASECLAFSNVPEDATLRRFDLDPVRDAQGWAAGVPRDNGADWTFEDTRHHYMRLLHGTDPETLRVEDLQRYLDVARATVAEVTERTFDEWRRPGSVTGGGLVWFARDLAIGAGWGAIDATGRPKSNFYALRRAFAPVRLFITDEGVNGLVLHGVNDGASAVSGRLMLECLRDGAVRVAHGSLHVELPGRGAASWPAFAILGGFFDAGHAYRFGAPAHDIVIATLASEARGALQAFWIPEMGVAEPRDAELRIAVSTDDTGYSLTLESTRALRSVSISDRTLVPDDNWFHLAPDRTKQVRLFPLPGQPRAAPQGTVRALDLAAGIPYG